MSTIKVTNLQNPSASSPAFVLNTDGTCSQLGIRNALINGNPTINQRGYVSGTATTAANEYTLDRWRVVVSGESVTWTDSENVRTVTAPAGGVEQMIEGINILSGTYTLNWTGTATATVDGSSVSKGGNVTLTGGTNCTVRFSNGTFSLAQLEPGSVATPFEHRSYGDELARCQRYYYRLGPVASQAFLGPSSADSATDGWATGSFPVEMRSAPSALEQSGTASDYVIRTGGTSRTCSAVPAFNSATKTTWSISTTVASGQTAGQAGFLRSASVTTAYLGWSAEL